MLNESVRAGAAASASIAVINSALEEMRAPRARFHFECFDKDGNLKWVDDAENLVTTQGKNDLLDKYFGGSSYTAAWFCGLISSVSYSTVAVGDTSAQINGSNGWKEAGATNAPNYSSGTRVALAFSAASGASKATSSASAFTFSGAGTIKGMFCSSSSTKDGTTGVLYNAVLFTGGDRVVASSDVVNVSVTYSA